MIPSLFSILFNLSVENLAPLYLYSDIMVNFSKAFVAAAAAILATQVVAHPGHDVAQEAAERNAFLQNSARRDLSHCSSSLRKRGVEDASIKRREAAIAKARAERGLPLSKSTSVLLTAT